MHGMENIKNKLVFFFFENPPYQDAKWKAVVGVEHKYQ
jgi:hypothetical protein